MVTVLAFQFSVGSLAGVDLKKLKLNIVVVVVVVVCVYGTRVETV